MRQRPIYQVDTIPNVYVPNKRGAKHVKQKLINWKETTNTALYCVYIHPLFSLIARSPIQKISKDTEEHNTTIIQHFLNTANSSSSIHTVQDRPYAGPQHTSNKFKQLKSDSVLSYKNGIQTEINNRKAIEKNP